MRQTEQKRAEKQDSGVTAGSEAGTEGCPGTNQT